MPEPDESEALELDLELGPAAPERKPPVEPGLCAAFNDVLEGFLRSLKRDKNASDHTVRAYRADIAQFLGYIETHPALGPGTLFKVERAHARAFLVGLQ